MPSSIQCALLFPPHRVWRYRGGRDGHETLQQFMNFLGRDRRTETTSLVERRKIGDERKGEEMEEGVRSTALERRPPSNPYAGVVIFCVPMATEIGGNIDMNSFQVCRDSFRGTLLAKISFSHLFFHPTSAHSFFLPPSPTPSSKG